LAFIEPVIAESNLPVVTVFNTLNWSRSGFVELFVQHEVVPEGACFTITDAAGHEIPYQKFQQRMEGAYYGFWVDDIPPMGYKTLQINVGKKPLGVSSKKEKLFENNFYRLTIAAQGGIIKQIYDKDLQRNLVDPNDTLTLGQLVYEQLDNRHEMERLTNSTRDTVYKPLGLTRTHLRNVEMTRNENGPVYNKIIFTGQLPGCADERGVKIEIRLYHRQKKIEFLYSMFKLPVYTPESVYVAFPFKLKGGKLAFEAQGGVVYPGINQLEGTSSDWNTLQNFAAVKGEEAQIVFVSNDVPLVHFGDINIGRYYYRLKPETNHIYSWVLNNYWVTNFKASQQGELRWKYSITSALDNSDMFAVKFGLESRTSLLSRVILPTKGAVSTRLVSQSFIELDCPGLLLVNAAPSMEGNGIILHLREVENGHASLDINRLKEKTGARSVQEVNVLEEVLSELTDRLLIEHYGVKFIRLNF